MVFFYNNFKFFMKLQTLLFETIRDLCVMLDLLQPSLECIQYMDGSMHSIHSQVPLIHFPIHLDYAHTRTKTYFIIDILNSTPSDPTSPQHCIANIFTKKPRITYRGHRCDVDV